MKQALKTLTLWQTLACVLAGIFLFAGCRSHESAPQTGSQTNVAAAPTDGGAFTGGGDATTSTDEQIFQTLHQIKRQVLPMAFYRIKRITDGVPQDADQSIEVPQPEFVFGRLQTVVAEMLAGNATNSRRIYDDIKQTRYRIKLTAGCVDNQSQEHAASVAHQASGVINLNNEICFSAERLHLIPFHSLERELLGLVAHEHAHRYGFNEEDSQKLQNLILRIGDFSGYRNFVNPDATTVSAIYNAAERVKTEAELLNLTAQGAATADAALNVTICTLIGRVSGLLSNSFGAGDNAGDLDHRGEGIMIHPGYWLNAGIVSRNIQSIASYCGLNTESIWGIRKENSPVQGANFTPVSSGDLDTLKTITARLMENAGTYTEDITDYLYGITSEVNIGKEPADLSSTITRE